MLSIARTRLPSISAALLCLAQAGCATVQSAAVQVEPAREGVIPIYLSATRPVAMMRLGGSPLIPMIFDTGADGNTLHPAVVTQAGLRRGGTSNSVDGATGQGISVAWVRLTGASLSGLSMGEAQADVQDFDRGDAMGIVSPQAFSGALVYLELGRNRVRIRPKNANTIPTAPATPYFDTRPGITMELPGNLRVTALLDSGDNQPFSLPLAMASQVPLFAPPVVVGTFQSISGSGNVYGARIRGVVRIGSVVLENPDVIFKSRQPNVGLPTIRQLTIILDPAERRSWLLRSTAPTPAYLDALVGRNAERSMRVEDGALVYQRQGKDPVRLVYLGADLFENPLTGTRFEVRREAGRVMGFDQITAEGNISRILWE